MNNKGVEPSSSIECSRSQGPGAQEPRAAVEVWVDEHAGYLFGYALRRGHRRRRPPQIGWLLKAPRGARLTKVLL